MEVINVVVDQFQSVVESMRGTFDASFDKTFGSDAPYFMFGHRLVIANDLNRKGKTVEYKYKKFPVVALIMDTDSPFKRGMFYHNLRVVIMTGTKQEYTTRQRYDLVFKPTLFPIYNRLLEALADSPNFTWPGSEFPEHVPTERPFWGTPVLEKNEKYIFDDPVDAIEITNLKINSRYLTDRCA